MWGATSRCFVRGRVGNHDEAEESRTLGPRLNLGLPKCEKRVLNRQLQLSVERVKEKIKKHNDLTKYTEWF
jgi:hypothetical protein